MRPWNILTKLLLITILALSASGVVSAKVASGPQNLSPGLHQGETVFNPLTHLAKIDFSTTLTPGSPVVTKGVLTPAQTSRIKSIENIIRQNAKPHDFQGVANELKGIKTGFDHVTEMQQSVRGLNKAIEGLKGSLKNPNLPNNVRNQIESSITRAESTLNKMNRALNGQ